MADNTPVNSQITDAVTQANVSVLGQSPSMAIGALNQALSNSLGMMFANAVSAQQQQNVLAQAATAQAVATIYGTSSSDMPDNMLALLTALKATQVDD